MSSKPSLSKSLARQTFVDLMTRIRFGRIRNLEVRDGEPVLAASTQVVREIHLEKPASHSSADRRTGRGSLSPAIAALFEELDRIGTGRIELVDVRHGVPFRIRVEEARS